MLASVALLALASSVFAAPNPQLPKEFKDHAGGGVAQQAIQVKLSQDGITGFQMANFLQNLEVAYFKQGAQKYKEWGGGNVNGVKNADAVNRIWGQEEAYVETIAELLKNNQAATVEPCEYNFPFSDEKSFLSLASIISNIGLGFLINIENVLAKSDPDIVPHIARILPVKARHDAFFRMYASEVPNPTPYETTLPMAWA